MHSEMNNIMCSGIPCQITNVNIISRIIRARKYGGTYNTIGSVRYK